MTRYKVKHRKTMVALIAALVGMLALGCIAYAAAPLIRDIFGWNIKKVEKYESMTDEQKLDQEIADIENHRRIQAVNASMMFEDIEITMLEFGFVSGGEPDQPQGFLHIRINYSSIPPFDPNYVAFKVRASDAVYPLHVDDNLSKSRRKGVAATTAEEITTDFWFSDTSYEDNGLITTLLVFKVPQWQIDIPLSMELYAEIDGKRLSLPFDFDPAKAHENAIIRAKASVSVMQEIMNEQKAAYAKMAQNASPIGITRNFNGNAITLSEMAYTDGFLCFSYSTKFSTLPDTKDTFGTYDINVLRVDGIEQPWLWDNGTSCEWEGDSELTITKRPLNRNEQNLPEQSLIYAHFADDWDQPGVAMIYRYNWNTGEVSLPTDEAEEATWFDQEGKLSQSYQDVANKALRFDLSGQQLTYEVEGVQLTVTDIRMRYDNIELTFTYEIPPINTVFHVDPAAAHFNDVAMISTYTHHSENERILVLLPRDNLMEIGEQNTLSLSAAAVVYDEKNVEVRTSEIQMDFALNMDTATWEDAEWRPGGR